VQHRVLMHSDYREQIEKWRDKAKPLQDIVEQVLITDCTPFLFEATATGAGITVLPSYAARIDPRLVMVETGVQARVQFWLVVNVDRREIRRISEAIKWIKSVFDPRKNPWFLEEFVHPRDFDKRIQAP
jgi:DNA-binding transcriptional LysR family regulator